MKRLWAPWRMKLFSTSHSGCIFCKVRAQKEDAQNFVVFRGNHSFVLLNRYPYTSGHLLVVCNDHLPSLEELNGSTRCEMFELATFGISVLRRVYKPDGFNLGANIGEAAGAGIPGHVHLHIVPRWKGDANFMSILGETRVIPEELEQTYIRIHNEWKET